MHIPQEQKSLRQVGWVDARPCGVSQLCWHSSESSDGGGARSASTQLLLAAGTTDGSVVLFHQTGYDLVKAASAGPRAGLMGRLGTAVQPDMRAVTCLAMTEWTLIPGMSPDATLTARAAARTCCITDFLHAAFFLCGHHKDVFAICRRQRGIMAVQLCMDLSCRRASGVSCCGKTGRRYRRLAQRPASRPVGA